MYINLPKYTTLHSTPLTLLVNLASSLTMTNTYTFAHQITALSKKPVTITFVNFAVYGLTLIRQLPVPLLPLSFTPNLITVILCTINSLSLNYLVSSRSRTLFFVLSWKLPSHVISEQGMGHSEWPMTQVIHWALDPWPCDPWPMGHRHRARHPILAQALHRFIDYPALHLDIAYVHTPLSCYIIAQCKKTAHTDTCKFRVR